MATLLLIVLALLYLQTSFQLFVDCLQLVNLCFSMLITLK